MPHHPFRRKALSRKRSNRDLFAALASGFVAALALGGVRSDPPTAVAECTPDAVPFQPLDERAVGELVQTLASDAGAPSSD